MTVKKPPELFDMPMPYKNREGVRFHDLEIGEAYELFSRNIHIGIWDGTDFHGIRHKFGSKFMCKETHAALDTTYGTAVAIRKLK